MLFRHENGKYCILSIHNNQILLKECMRFFSAVILVALAVCTVCSICPIYHTHLSHNGCNYGCNKDHIISSNCHAAGIFCSVKFMDKIRYVHTLEELSQFIPMEHVQIPECVLQ